MINTNVVNVVVLFWVNNFSNQFDFCFPLCSIHKIIPYNHKNQTGLKILKPKKKFSTTT